jgi:hypothetical protein
LETKVFEKIIEKFQHYSKIELRLLNKIPDSLKLMPSVAKVKHLIHRWLDKLIELNKIDHKMAETFRTIVDKHDEDSKGKHIKNLCQYSFLAKLIVKSNIFPEDQE